MYYLTTHSAHFIYSYQWRIQTFHLVGTHEMRLNAKGTVGRFGGQKLIYNKAVIRKI